MNTTENNKKIAEFMGAKIKGNPILNEYEMYGIIECIEDGENEQHHFIPQEMKFNSDWNWLMEVVIECFNRSEDMLDDINFKLNDALLETNIESLYKAVVTFIDWYNENSAKER